MYSVKATSLHTGLSPETLRAWERRYGAVCPKRDSSGRRSYSPDELLRLQLLRSVTQLGHPIRKVAGLGNAELRTLAGDDESRAADERAGSRLAQRLIEAAIAFDHAQCERALSVALALLPTREVIRQVAGPALKQIGQMWHDGDASIAQERVLSSSVRRVFDAVIGHVGKHTQGRPLLFATLAGERHDLGSLMAAFHAASLGFDCRYLGDGLPAEELARLATGTGAALIALSLVMPVTDPPFHPQLAALCHLAPTDCAVWAGGESSRDPELTQVAKRLVRMDTLDEFDRRLRLMLA